VDKNTTDKLIEFDVAQHGDADGNPDPQVREISRTKGGQGTPSMNMQSRVSFLTNNAEVRTIRRDLSPVLDPAGSHDWVVSDDFTEDGAPVDKEVSI
jgi:hypothetical protein